MPATKNPRQIYCLLICLFCGASLAYAQSDNPSTSFPRVSLPNTELRLIHSEVVDDDYQLYVALPSSYVSDTMKTYPVLYVVDANFGFAAITQMYRGFILSGEVSEMILVGIGYPTDSLGEFFERRNAELVPERPGQEFMRVILEEIIPFVEAEYRTSGARAFGGYSRGGLF